MATVQHQARVNAKGEIVVPWQLFRQVHPDEVWDIVVKKTIVRAAHTIRPTHTTAGVKEFI